MEFGKLLKQERKKMNLTQADLAEQLNVSRSAISNWEIGRNYPDIQTIIDISNVLGVSLDYLLNEDQKIMEAVDNDLTKKKKIKKISVILAGLLLVAIGTIIFLLYPKKNYDNFC
ncbi:helix-turn-helix domain-containing protein [Enterococcus hirae]|uniref:helix-turn-helix domain-containing protein n=1 Tax=Enterococcus hirae TaxID=1354 RepID=UPI0037989C3A